MKATLIAITLGATLLAGCASEELDPKAAAEASASASAAAADKRRVAANEAAARKAAEAQASQKAAAEALASALAAAPPDPAHFKIGIVVLEKECFASAGCNITYRIDPSYNGPSDISDTEVTYEVVGGEDGAIVNTFEIDGSGEASFDEREFASTASSRKALTARVTSVRRK